MDNKQYYNPQFLISHVAQMLNIHPQTLRQYEREGLIKPSRTNGQIRMYSQADLDDIKDIMTLTRDMGVNLAGVEIILQLKEQINNLKLELNQYKNKLASYHQGSVVPNNKAMVIKKEVYNLVVV
jgi:MerR family transcriptional regulator/heat shock protein HspR